MDTVRILLLGMPFTPIFELGERLSEYHNMDYFTIERENDYKNIDYFSDKIPAIYLDTNDFMTGSESSQGPRDPMSTSKMKALDEISVPLPEDPLSDEERGSLMEHHRMIVASQVLDPWLATEWADVVLYLKVNDRKAADWLSKRRKCPSCGAAYHLEDRPMSAGELCDRCGTTVVMLDKDRPENVRKQFQAWRSRAYRIELSFRDLGNEKFATIDIDKVTNFDEIVKLAERFLRKKINRSRVNWGYSI